MRQRTYLPSLDAASIGVVSKTRPVVAAIEMMQTTNGAESLYLFNSATTDKCGHCYKITLFSGMGIVVSVVQEIPLCI